ncbi:MULTISPECIES: response regulator transcription factor [Hymenobacter]|uniref:Response regulator transcription factor n=1 Tax=Hymenobacter armeniacus TaxID=2771358 RepID=A0ABR8JPU4_9BACT|nr:MULTISPECIES: response regulator transcription factor [Hymenobacter]MBD2720783.1 response regulator transcription factor [Hymenobacter armeniacus]MBJ6109878.1 response regulator transcription factor [Hymenobacter sp. BT523]
MKILLVEDEPQVASFIKKGFEHEGYELTVGYDGSTGWSLYQQQPYDLVILDVNLPHLNGVELCRLIRAGRHRVPVLMLTALDSLADKEAGFEAGADDYLAKPFAFRELLLRARALTKRYAETGAPQLLRLADLELNLDSKIVTRAGRRIDLTTREYSLLEHLLLNQGRIVSRVDIAERVWEVDFDTTTNIIDVYIGYLRKKIDKGFEPKLIHTVVGMGYVMREQ